MVGRTRNVVICSVMEINGDEKSREIGVPKEFVTRCFRASSLARQWSFSIISWVSLIFEMDLVKNGKVENILYANLLGLLSDNLSLPPKITSATN